jgi:predicted DNA-binding protein (UPF0251 family)/predicted Fe-Mo cluster-binding NifX family protein
MPRPSKCRFIENEVQEKAFARVEIDTLIDSEFIELGRDELEALKLTDYDALSHADAAERMGVSRATLGRIVEKARKKLIEAVLFDKTLAVGGGAYCTNKNEMKYCNRNGKHCRKQCGINVIKLKDINMDYSNFKAAFVTNDGETISKHFGPSKSYLIAAVKDGQIVSKELIEKPNFHTGEHGHSHGEHGHSHSEHNCGGSDSGRKHIAMVQPILGCSAIIVGGMGQGMLGHLAAASIAPILTRENSIDEALAKLIKGELISDDRLAH